MNTKPLVRVPANLSGPAFTSDGLVNFVSRMGLGADKAAHGTYIGPVWQNRYEIDAAYRTSWFRKIVDIPPEDEVREWRAWTGADAEQITAIDDEEKRLGLRAKVKEARILARKDGGSAIVIGVGGTNLRGPLDPERVGKDGLLSLTVVSRYEISPKEKNRDINNEYYGLPSFYVLNGATMNLEIHPSRVIRFVGNPIRDSTYWDGWGESLWIELTDAIRRVDQISGGVASMVEEAKLDVIRIKNLMQNMATAQYEEALIRRWTAINAFKSTNNALLLDADDEFEQKTLGFQGLPDVHDRAMMVMSGMADIPATRLLGRSPQGMNATGESDMRNYYDRITAAQENTISPALRIADECLIRSALGSRPEEIYYEWNPLYSLSEKEAADVEKIYAETAVAYANSGLIPDTALTKITQNGIVERGQWPGAETAFQEAEDEGDEAGILAEPTEAEQAEEQARAAIAKATAADPAGMAGPRPKLVAANDSRFLDATPRTLYVRRDVVNVAEITKWARSQGFTDILPDLHVTIVSSRQAIDWMAMGSSWESRMEIPAGGPRIVDRLGSDPLDPFYVLLFASSELQWRHRAALDAGASWDFSEYQPHISIQRGGTVDLAKVTPYRGKIILGPEIFEERKVD